MVRRSIVAAALLPSAVTAFLSSPSSPRQWQHCSTSHLGVASTLVATPSAFVDYDHPPPSPAGTPSATDADRAHTRRPSPPAATPPPAAASPLPPPRPPRALPNGATLALVGAGPGSPDLLTVAAHRIITDPASFLVVDRLVSREILDLIAGEYRVANKHPGCQATGQEEIYAWCKEGLEAGRQVVRLKIGDPFVFGRGGEEVLEFREFGVEPTVIPGVSAAFSAPLLGSIPVTHRGVSNQVVMCTGYGKENTSPDLIRYHPEQTVVFLMAVGRLRTLCERLVTLAHYPPDTPVGVVERAGCPDQRTVVGTVANIADLAAAHDVRPPSTIVVGEVVGVLLTERDFGGVVAGAARPQGLVTSS